MCSFLHCISYNVKHIAIDSITYDTFERIRTKESCWPLLFYPFLQKSQAPCPLIQADIYSTVDINMDFNVSFCPICTVHSLQTSENIFVIFTVLFTVF